MIVFLGAFTRSQVSATSSYDRQSRMVRQPTGCGAVRRATCDRRCRPRPAARLGGHGRGAGGERRRPARAGPVTGSAGVMAVVLAQAVAGATALLFVGPLWGTVKMGFFKLTGSVILVLAVAAWLTARAGAVPGVDAGRWSVTVSYTHLTLPTTPYV